MSSLFKRPEDTPAAACGRCIWWQQTDSDGWGCCVFLRRLRWHKNMVCGDYEMDTTT